MTQHMRQSKLTTVALAVVVVVVICCVEGTSGQGEDVNTTTTNQDLINEDNNYDEVTIGPESVGDPEDETTDEEKNRNQENEPTETNTTTITTTTTTATTTTTTTPAVTETVQPNINTTTTTFNTTTTSKATPPTTTTTTTNATQTTTPTTTNTTTESPCGVNAYMKGEECVCLLPWTHDPADPESPCTCPDLCRRGGEVICPPEASCTQVTCNLATCSCPNHLAYSPSTASCISPCELYGGAVCGLGLGWKCVAADEGMNFTCQCVDGYELKDNECKDIDECVVSTESDGDSPCDVTTEKCINTEGSHVCTCQEGFYRVANGSCVNMNECLNPRLHNCDHVCHDAQPPTRYKCDCFMGHSWNETLQRCLRDDPRTSCECGSPEKSVCYRSLEGDEHCFQRPGFIRNATDFIDAPECNDSRDVEAWCWAGGHCVEGVGGSECVCAPGFTSDTPYNSECMRLTCPEGTVVTGSKCVDPCSIEVCPAPLTCRVQGREPSCKCLSQCLNIYQSEPNISIYYGSFLVQTTFTRDFDLPQRVVKALEEYFGSNAAEVIAVTKVNSTESPPVSASASHLNATSINSIEFAMMIPHPNVSSELPRAIKSVCREMGNETSLCVLPGGLQVVKDSITFIEKDPCKDNPCPGGRNFTCQVTVNTTGRFICDCDSGFSKVDVSSYLGYCRDVDECEEKEKLPCGEYEDCLNIPGSFMCMSRLSSLGQNPETLKKTAITFGVLFLITFLSLIGALCLLKKKNKANRELVPMTSTGFDNSAYRSSETMGGVVNIT